MPTIMILRGLPGSGKSTKAKAFAQQNHFQVFSTDNFFLNSEGVYLFSANKIAEAHEHTLNLVASAMEAGKNIVLDNTNIWAWEMKPYVLLAKKHGYAIALEPCIVSLNDCIERNIHDVPISTMRKMFRAYNPNLTVKDILNSITLKERQAIPDLFVWVHTHMNKEVQLSNGERGLLTGVYVSNIGTILVYLNNAYGGVIKGYEDLATC